MDEISNKLYEVLQEHCRLATVPVAVKLAKKGDATPQKFRRPLAQVGKRLAGLSEPQIPEKYHQIAPQGAPPR